MSLRNAAIAAVSLLCAQAAHAEVPAFKPGDLELNFAGGLSRQSTEARLEVAGPDLELADEDATVLSLTVNPGYFVTKGNEVGVIAGLRWIDSDSVDSNWDALGGVSYTYNLNLPGSTIVPTFGALARTVLFDAVTDYTYGVNAGVRVLANESISVNWQLYYEYEYAEDVFSGFGNVVEEDTVIGVRVGFSWIVRRG